MKTILVPTDFSDTANKARDYAVVLAEQLSAEIVLLNTYHIPYSGASAGTIVNLGKVAHEESEKSMSNQKEYLDLNFPNLSFRTLCKPGLLLESIKKIGKNKEVDLIVMGTNGASGIVGNAIGSNTSALVGKIDIPLIAVPVLKAAVFPKKIVVANDLLEVKEGRLVNSLNKMAINNETEVDFLFVVNEYNEADFKIDRLQRLNANVKFKTSYNLVFSEDSLSVEESVFNYVSDHKNDLLVLVSHQRSFLQGLFHKSVSKSFVKQASLPIMVFPS